MLVKELIKELQKYDKNETVKCLGKTTDWRFNGNESESYDTCEWMDVEGVALRKYGGEDMITIYANNTDLED